MKVVIKAASVELGGALTYLGDFLRQAAAMAPDCECVVLLPSETIPKLPALPKSVRLVGTRTKGINPVARIWWEQVSLRKLLAEEKPDLVYATGNFGMFHCPVRQLLLVEGRALFFENLSADDAAEAQLHLASGIRITPLADLPERAKRRCRDDPDAGHAG